MAFAYHIFIESPTGGGTTSGQLAAANAIYAGPDVLYSTTAPAAFVDANGYHCGWTDGVAGFLFSAAARSDIRLRGTTNMNSEGIQYRINLPSGDYDFIAPTGFNGIDGPASLKIVDGEGNILVDVNTNTTMPQTSVLDIDNAVKTEAAFTASPAVKRVTVRGGYIVLSKGAAQAMRVRSFGYQAAATPLQGVTLTDEYGDPITTVYAQQPANKLFARINVAVGAKAPANFSVSGTFGGGAGAFFDLVIFKGDLWLAHKAGAPVPDNAATGSIIVTQTDSSSGVTGSPFVTTFNGVTCTSSQGRPTAATDTSVFGLISTQAWLDYKAMRDLHMAAWQGFAATGTTFFGDAAVASTAQLMTQWATFAGQAAAGRKFRIRLQNGAAGAWSDSITGGWPDGDFLKDGTGGLLIEPDTGHDPAIDGSWYWGGARGVEVRGIRATGNGSVSYNDWLRLIAPGGTIYNQVIIRNCRFQAKNYNPNVSPMIQYAPVRAFFGDLLRVLDCDFGAFSNGIDACSVRLFESARNDFQHHDGDCHGISCFSGGTELKGAQRKLVDDDCYMWIHDCTNRAPHDNFAGVLVTTANHPDFIQNRGVVGGSVPYRADTDYPIGKWEQIGPNYYRAKNAGRTGLSSPPSGTGANIVDGTINWEFVGTTAAGPKLRIVTHGNRLHSGGTGYSDDNVNVPTRLHAVMQFYIDSGGDLATGFCAFDNVNLSGTALGYLRDTSVPTLKDKLEYNTLLAPAIFPPQGSYDVADYQGIAATANPNLARSYRNITGLPVTTFSEGDVRVDQLPGAVAPFRAQDQLAGAFSLNAEGFTVFALQNDGLNTRAAFRAELESQIRAKSGVNAGIVVAGVPTSTVYNFTFRFRDAAGKTLTVPFALTERS